MIKEFWKQRNNVVFTDIKTIYKGNETAVFQDLDVVPTQHFFLDHIYLPYVLVTNWKSLQNTDTSKTGLSKIVISAMFRHVFKRWQTSIVKNVIFPNPQFSLGAQSCSQCMDQSNEVNETEWCLPTWTSSSILCPLCLVLALILGQGSSSILQASKCQCIKLSLKCRVE